MTELDSKINEWCDFISNDLAERKFYDKTEVAAYAKVKLVLALQECIRIQQSSLEADRIELVKRYTSEENVSKKFKLGGEIAVINKKIKERNIALKSLDNNPSNSGENKKEKVISCTNSGAWISCRIKSIGEPFRNRREFTANSSYNKKIVDCNESNLLTFVLQPDNFDLINKFSVNDIVAVKYQLVSKLINSDRNVYAHNLICVGIMKFEEKN